MNSRSIFAAGFALFFMTVGANATGVPLDVTNNYIFPLAGGGGGAMATLNGVPVEIFCDDFDSNINLGGDYSASVTTLGTGANLDDTRFGGVSGSGWTQFTTLGAVDDSFFNTGGSGSTALARYAMVAYLVSLYNQTSQSSTTNTDNNEIQNAIWSIMDPAGETVINTGYNGTSYAEQAASWYMGMSGNQTALNAFLSQFEIVSPANMNCSNNLVNCGFQEQIVDPLPTPEPRGVMVVLFGLLGLAVLLLRRASGLSFNVQ